VGVKALLSRAIELSGYRVVRTAQPHVQRYWHKDDIASAHTPLTLTSLLDAKVPEIVFLRTDQLMSWRLMVAHVEAVRAPSLAEDILWDFFESFKPASVADVLGISPTRDWHLLPADCVVLPWDSTTPERAAWNRRRIMVSEAQEHGLGGWRQEYGWKCWGPPTKQLVEFEASRLRKVSESIDRGGLDPLQLPGLRIFTRGADMLARPEGGLHRVAALIGLGWELIPFSVKRRFPTAREHHESWPNVASGLFSPQEALSVFDARFIPMAIDGSSRSSLA